MPGEGERHQHRQRLAQETSRTKAARDHDHDADERQSRSHERARRDALAVDEEADRRGGERQGGVDHHHVGDGRRHNSRGIGGDGDHRQERDERRERAEAERVGEASPRIFNQADDGDRGRAKQRTPADHRPYVKMGEEAGKHARQAPQDRGDEDQQHAAPARGLLARHGKRLLIDWGRGGE